MCASHRFFRPFGVREVPSHTGRSIEFLKIREPANLAGAWSARNLCRQPAAPPPSVGAGRVPRARSMPFTRRVGSLWRPGVCRATCSVLSPLEQVSDQLLSLLIERLADEPTQSSSRADPRSGACDNHGDGEPGGRGRREHHQPAPGAAALRIGRRHGLAAPEVPGDRSRNALPPQSGLA